MFKKKIKRSLLTLGSIAGAAALNYSIVHNPLVFFMFFVLFIHEIGHYFIGKYHKADVSYPIFIPIPFFSIGLTRIKNLSKDKIPTVALSGVLFSSFYLLFLILNNYFVSLFSFTLLFTFLFFEIFLNFIGFDGHKYRTAKLNITT